jgi:SAM-dependent methyltransferase
MSDINTPEYWEMQYQKGQVPWELGRPTPVFQRLQKSGRFPPGRMMVVGAGRGHDARFFAREGFGVTAVDFALEAVQAMRDLDDLATPVEILEEDIFNLPAECQGIFDYVLEYTCFCSIDPGRRGAYGDVVASLLKPGGHYIALAFPNIDRRGGPPFPVSPDELIELLAERGLTLEHREIPADSVPGRRGYEELLVMRK